MELTSQEKLCLFCNKPILPGKIADMVEDQAGNLAAFCQECYEDFPWKFTFLFGNRFDNLRTEYFKKF